MASRDRRFVVAGGQAEGGYHGLLGRAPAADLEVAAAAEISLRASESAITAGFLGAFPTLSTVLYWR